MATRKEKKAGSKNADSANQIAVAEISAMSLTNAQKSADLKIAASEISRRSYTSPNEVEIEID